MWKSFETVTAKKNPNVYTNLCSMTCVRQKNNIVIITMDLFHLLRTYDHEYDDDKRCFVDDLLHGAESNRTKYQRLWVTKLLLDTFNEKMFGILYRLHNLDGSIHHFNCIYFTVLVIMVIVGLNKLCVSFIMRIYRRHLLGDDDEICENLRKFAGWKIVCSETNKKSRMRIDELTVGMFWCHNFERRLRSFFGNTFSFNVQTEVERNSFNRWHFHIAQNVYNITLKLLENCLWL